MSEIPPVATDNVLENIDGVPPPFGSEHPIGFSRGGSLLPSSYADTRYIAAGYDVIVSKAFRITSFPLIMDTVVMGTVTILT